jgi:hypothetical protein
LMVVWSVVVTAEKKDTALVGYWVELKAGC